MKEFNQEKANAFMEKMIGVLNGGAVSLMLSIGHRVGLFDTMASLAPSTSFDIANAAGLNERYVREWLGAMVTGGIVSYEPKLRTYNLPREHAAFLTRSASPNNMAVGMQFISVLGGVEDRVVECFRNGGGVPYSEYPRFHQVMAEESGQTVVAALLEHILPLVPELNDALSKGINVLDVGCGSGRALISLAVAFPRSRFTGYDFSEEAINKAVNEAKERGLSNIRFEVKDVATLNGSARYDLITAFDSIHDQAQPAKVLKRIAGALDANGIFLMQDISGSSDVEKDKNHPLGPMLYTISCMHCMTVSLAYEGEGLGAMWGEQKAKQMLADVGFTNVEVKQLPHDVMNNYFIATIN